MKFKIKYLMSALLLAGLVSSCSEDKTTFNPNDVVPSSMNAASTTDAITLTKDTEGETAITLGWTKAFYGFPSAPTYTVQASLDPNFAESQDGTAVVNLKNSTTLTAEITGIELNKALIGTFKCEANTEVEVFFRVYSNLSEYTTPVYSSNVISYKIIPFAANYDSRPKVYIVGTLNGWNINNDALYVASDKGDGVYSAEIGCPENENTFRFYKKLGDWENNSIGWQVDDSPREEVITSTTVGEKFNLTAVDGKGSWKISKGLWKMTLDLNAMTLVCEYLGEYVGPEPEPEPEPEYPSLYLRGQINGNNWDGAGKQAVAASIGSNDVYVLNNAEAGDSGDGYAYFRAFTTLNDWDGQYGVVGGSNVVVDMSNGFATLAIESGSGGCWQLPANKKYNITIDTQKMTINIVEVSSSIYMVGNINGWNIEDGSAPMCGNGDGIYRAFGMYLPSSDGEGADSYFRPYSEIGSWDAGSMGSATGEDFPLTSPFDATSYAEGSSGAFCAAPGSYDVVVDTNNKTIKITPCR